MSIWDMFKRKESKEIRYTFEDEDRKLSNDIRKSNAELRRLEFERRNTLAQMELEKARYELQALRAELAADDDEEIPNTMDSIMPLLLAKFLGGGNSNVASPATIAMPPTPSDSKIELTDAQIEEIKAKVPRKYQKLILAMDSSTARALIASHFPNLSDSSMDRLLKCD
jgi:hypothetical protein